MGQVIGRVVSRYVEDAIDTDGTNGIVVDAIHRSVMDHKVLRTRATALATYDQNDGGESAEMFGAKIKNMIRQRLRAEHDVSLGFKLRKILPVRCTDGMIRWFKRAFVTPEQAKELGEQRQRHARVIDNQYALFFDYGEWAEDQGLDRLGDDPETYLRQRLLAEVPLPTVGEVRRWRVSWKDKTSRPLSTVTGIEVDEILAEYSDKRRASGVKAKKLYRIREEYRVRKLSLVAAVEVAVA